MYFLRRSCEKQIQEKKVFFDHMTIIKVKLIPVKFFLMSIDDNCNNYLIGFMLSYYGRYLTNTAAPAVRK